MRPCPAPYQKKESANPKPGLLAGRKVTGEWLATEDRWLHPRPGELSQLALHPTGQTFDSVQVDFESYVTRVMNESTISECDLMTLFGWPQESPRDRNCLYSLRFFSGLAMVDQSRHDRTPYEQLIGELPPSQKNRHSKSSGSLKKRATRAPWRRPGSSHQHSPPRNKTQSPSENTKHQKALRASIERHAKQQHWPEQPFNGLDAELRQTIRHRYECTNREFCQTFWPFGATG